MPQPPDYAELGSSGLRRASGFVTEEILPALHGRKGAGVFRELS